MEVVCKTCKTVFNKKLTLKEKNDGYKPKFCSQDCAIAWSLVKEKKLTKSTYRGARQSSKEEVAFGELIRSYFPQLESQYMFDGYNHHYDFYSPELNLIIEYNGTYWHNMPKTRIKDKKHLREATNRGVYMAVVSDIEWKAFLDNGLPDKSKIVKLLNNSIKNMEK